MSPCWCILAARLRVVSPHLPVSKQAREWSVGLHGFGMAHTQVPSSGSPQRAGGGDRKERLANGESKEKAR